MSGAGPPKRGQAFMNLTGPMADWGKKGLEMVGIKTGKPADKKAAELPVLSLNQLLWLGARLPFGAFIAILIAFTYLYHIQPLAPWLLAFLCIDFAVLVAWPPKQIGTKARTYWDWAPMMSWLFAIVLAIGFGLTNYGIIESWVNATFLQEYSNVKFNDDTRAMQDAGILNFAEGTNLVTDNAAGHQSWLDSFCAAPIVNTGGPKAAPVGFWAVGKGCCKSRGTFTCDAAEDKAAHSGMPIRPHHDSLWARFFGRTHNLGPEETANYNKAIKMAAAANGLEVAEEPVFVMWVKSPHNVGRASWWAATTLLFTLSGMGLLACCAVQTGLTHISEMEH